MEPVDYFNRYTGKIEREAVYGEAFLRWTYHHALGRVALHSVTKRAFFSRYYGWRMSRAASRRKVLPFIQNYRLNPSEFADPPESFRSFNEFFYRKLKPAARPIDSDPQRAVFPADGRHLGFPRVSSAAGIFVKGQMFDLNRLLQSDEMADRYREGSMVISRLCPVDYHRFHFPVSGVAEATRCAEGFLFSVNPIALRHNINYYTSNKRCICEVSSDRFGPVVMVEVGATCVGAIVYTYEPRTQIAKGQEKGFFMFGGSSMVTLFEKDRITLDSDLVENTRSSRELYAHMGDHMGRANSAPTA